MGCGCGGSRRADAERLRQAREQATQTREEAIAKVEQQGPHGMYYEGPARNAARAKAE